MASDYFLSTVNAFSVVVTVLLVLILGLFVTSLVRAAALSRASQSWPTAPGRVVDMKRRSRPNVAASQGAGLPAGSIQQTVWQPIVEFTDSAGNIHRVAARTRSRRHSLEVGQQIRVKFDPANPDRAVVDG